MIFKWKAKESIGLDWGFHTWKWLRLQPLGEDRYALKFLDILPLSEDEKENTQRIQKYVVEKGLEGSPTAVAFQDEHLSIRRLELPRMPQEDLQEAIRWQMRDIAEESLEKYTIRYSLLDEKVMTDIVRLILLGYAVKTETIQKKMAFLQQVGLKPFFMEPTPVTMATIVEHLYPSEEGGWIGCCDLGFRHPYFIVLGRGKLHFVRTLPGLGDQKWESQDYASKLSVELQHALDAFFITYQTEKIQKIFLAGGGAQHPNLPEIVSKNIGIPAEILNPFQKLEHPEPFLTKERAPYFFGPALASARITP